MLILPAIDIYAGRTVRLRQGAFDACTTYQVTPVDAARAFADAGLTSLHLVDLEGARGGRLINWQTLASILAIPGLNAEIGGGIRDRSDIARLLGMGAWRVVIGSIAVREPELLGRWIAEFGPDRVVVALDLRGGAIAVNGWLEEARVDPFALMASMIELGARDFVCTDIERDGMLDGPNVPLYTTLIERFPEASVVASGGIGAFDDLDRLEACGVAGAIVGKALYEGRVSLSELARRRGASRRAWEESSRC